MSSRLRLIGVAVSFSLACVLAFSATAAFADEMQEVDASPAFAADALGLTDEPALTADTPLTAATVTWSTPRCGEPMTFTIHPQGGSGNYKYRYYGIMDKDFQILDIALSHIPGATQLIEGNTFDFTFMASGTYTIRFQVIDMATFQYVLTPYYTFTIDDPRYPSVDDIVANLAAQAMAKFSTDFDRALWLHDQLLARADYDYSYSFCGAEGVLARGKGTCESYQRAFAKLLDAVGIPNGRAEGNNHTWNVVYLDGNWYQIDATWNDGGAAAYPWESHFFYGLTDELMFAAHDQHKTDPKYPCTAYEDNYFIKTGEISAWTDPLMPEIRAALDAGKTAFSIPITAKNTAPTFYFGNERYCTIMYTLVAYALNQMEWTATDGRPVTLEAAYVEGGTLAFDVTYGATPGPGTDPVDPADPETGFVLPTGMAAGTQVFIDGVAYTVGEKGLVTLPTATSRLMTTYTWNTADASDLHKVYPTHMAVWELSCSDRTYTATRLSAFDDALQYAGSSIRIEGVKGIRMITGVPTALKAALTAGGVAGYTLEEYGTLVTWADTLDGAATLETPGVKSAFAYKQGVADPVFATTAGTVQFTNVLVGFTTAQCADDLVMRPYMVLRDSAGNRVVLYGGEVHRSISYIAYQNRAAFAEGTAAYDYIWDIINSVGVESFAG